jgi:galactitol-specific phosphotransferase system IIC component
MLFPAIPFKKRNQMSPFKLGKKDGMQGEYVCVGKLLSMGRQNSSYLGLQAS